MITLCSVSLPPDFFTTTSFSTVIVSLTCIFSSLFRNNGSSTQSTQDTVGTKDAGGGRGGRSVKAIPVILVIPGNIDVVPVSSGGFTPGDLDDTHEAVINEKTARFPGVRIGGCCLQSP